MANELSIRMKLKYTASVAAQEDIDVPEVNFVVDMTNDGVSTGVASVTDSAAAFATGLASNIGWCLIKNVGSTTVRIGQAGNTDITIESGEAAFFRCAAIAVGSLLASTATGSSTIQYWVFED